MPLQQQQAAPVFVPQFANTPNTVPPPQFCPPPQGGPPPPDASPFSLPNDGSPNGFSDDKPGCGEGIGVCLNVGWIALQRQSLGNRVLGFLDPNVDAHNGTLPPPGTPAVLNTHDVSPNLQSGVCASVIFREGDFAFEICGFYLGQQTESHTTLIPGQLTLGYAYFPPPRHFEGANGLWAQADLTTLSLQTTMANGEANFRFNTTKEFEFIVGLRYLDYQERFSVFTDEVSFTTGVVIPSLQALDTMRIHNRIVAGQIGCETEHVLTSRIGVGATAKCALGANFADSDVLLRRGDGVYGPSNHRSTVIFSQIFELGVYADFLLTEQCRLRAGYQGLWLVDVPDAPSQLNFNLRAPGAIFRDHRSVFFYGPGVQVQFVF
jgi:hypothetical protein